MRRLRRGGLGRRRLGWGGGFDLYWRALRACRNIVDMGGVSEGLNEGGIFGR